MFRLKIMTLILTKGARKYILNKIINISRYTTTINLKVI